MSKFRPSGSMSVDAHNFYKIRDFSLAPVREGVVLTPDAYESIARGAFCLIVASVEAYFTNVGVSFSRNRFSTSNGDELEKCVDSLVRLDSGKNKKTIKGADFSDANSVHLAVHSVMTAATFNNAHRVELLADHLFPGSNFNLWNSCVRMGLEGDESSLAAEWELVIQRRNDIMHRGDLDQQGIRFRRFDPDHVFRLSDISSAMVGSFEENLSRHYD